MDSLVKKSHKKVETKTTDAKNTLGIANCTFKMMQKAFADFFKPELPKKIKTCAVDNFVTSKLFGDDLCKQIKESTDVCRVNRKIVHSNGAEKNNQKYLPYDKQNSYDRGFWTTKYEVDFYTKVLHCNRQRYSVLRIIYALFIRKMEENNTLRLFKTLEVFYLEFYGVQQKTKMPRNIPFSSEEKNTLAKRNRKMFNYGYCYNTIFKL